MDEFCNDNGEINWVKIVQFNSATIKPKLKKSRKK